MATTLQYVNETTFDNPRDISRVRIVAGYYFATFFCVMFTGSIRKWLFHAAVLYLFQDIPILFVYLYALKSGTFSRGYLFLGTMFLSLLITLQTLAQIMISGHEIIVAIVGLHHYLFYLPMLLIFPLALTPKYRRDFVWWNLILSLPMCLLAIAQAQSSKSAWINRTSEGDAFGLPGVEVARVSGTFNFTVFYGIWVGIAVACCMGEWLLPPGRRVLKSRWLLIACTFAVNICHLVSGSRSAIALSGASIAGALVAAILLRSTRAIVAIGGVFLFLPVAAGVTYLASPVSFNAVVDRFTGSKNVADNKQRVGGAFIAFAARPTFSLIGAGVGMGVDASHFGKANTYLYTYDLDEGDMSRNVMELGTPIGWIYSLTRIGFVFGMVFLAFRLVHEGSSPHVLPLSFILFFETYIGDLTRAATMTSTQLFLGYSFILGTYLYPDGKTLENSNTDFLARSA